jgi:hypothetical protein
VGALAPIECPRNGVRRLPNWLRKLAGRVENDMTINVGLLTSDAAVLGSDSVASTTNYYIDPIRLPWVRTADGKGYLKDSDGKFTLKFDYSDYEAIVTNAWGGVTKLFKIHEEPTPVAVVTAGVAKLSDRPIASLGAEFREICSTHNRKLVNVDAICNSFLKFMRAKYEKHYKGSSLPKQLLEGPEFLAAGFGRDDTFPTLFRIKIKEIQLSSILVQQTPELASRGMANLML